MIKILIVDDAGHIRNLLEKLLSMYGVEVFAAEDGVVALSLYKEHHPDLVFSDMQMPNMDGIELVKQLIAFDPNAKICMVTSLSMPKYIQEAILAGAKYYIVKPFDKKKIIDTIELMLGVRPEAKAFVSSSSRIEGADPDARTNYRLTIHRNASSPSSP